MADALYLGAYANHSLYYNHMDLERLHALKNIVLEQTPQARRIIAELYRRADWTTRHELAKSLKKNRLNPHDVGLLDRLALNGLVEIRRRDRPGRIGYEFIYRLDAKTHRGLNLLRQYSQTQNSN